MANKKDGMWQKPDPETYIVQMENLTSEEVYLAADETQTPVLTGNTLTVKRGESWGIVGEEAFEVELLLQIIGCVRPYGSGKCKLVERGMMRKKRKILPHVFFVGDSGMAVPNMSVLEYLMFATRFTGGTPRERQIAILQAMLGGECYEWCFAPVKYLSSQERAVLSLLAASFSDALLIIFPYFYKETPPALISMIAYIARALEKKRAALIIGARDAQLVQATCSHSAFLIRGTLREQGTLDEVTKMLDRRDYILSSAEPEALRERLSAALPAYEVRLRGDCVDVYHKDAEPLTQKEMFQTLSEIGAPVTEMHKSERTLMNAFSEVSHDLSNELL